MARDLFGEFFEGNLLELNASVGPETPIMIKENDKIQRINFYELEKRFFKKNEKYAKPSEIEILSIDKNNEVKFMPMSLISRHKVPKIARIKYEGGEIRTSLNHSVIIIDNKGNLTSKEVSQLKVGDQLVTFRTTIQSADKSVLEFERYSPILESNLQGHMVRNPKVKQVLQNQIINDDIAWLFGAYLAEGCLSFRGDTSGSLIFTFGYPKETDQIEKVQAVLKENFHLDSSTKIGFSGFDRSKASSMQVRAHNTQLARFFKEQFYNGSDKNTAQFKRVPSFIYNSRYRWDFLKGYINDAYGEWGRYLRYSSRSKENLIDITWLGRISGIDSSCFDVESRFVWKKDLPQKLKTDLISAEPIIYLFKEKDDEIDFNWRYILRHQLYSQKSKRISKDLARDLLVKAEGKIGNSHVQKLLKLVNSPLSVVLIRQIDVEEYDNYVYDVSVPGSEMFWGGTAPILLHNSDTRGIDVIRTTVKNFARTMGLGDVPFKILILDEADNMTSDAQQALRRTMEKYTRTCRFILIGNYSSKIIEPIQSRCSIFRFPPLSQADVTKQLKSIAKKEEVDLTDEGITAILESARGDMRNNINILQAAAAYGGEIKAHVVYQVTGRVHPEEIREMITYALKNNFMDAREQLHSLLIKYGLSGIDILKQMNSEIMKFKDDDLKVKLINLLGEAEFRLSEGANEEIQLNALLANIVLLGDKYKDAEL